jgi:anti-sigma B factor antagonist
VDEFSASRATERGCDIIAVSGDLDLHTTRDLETHIDEILQAGGHRPLIVDLSQVGFLDSTAIDLLLRTRSRLQDQGRQMMTVGQTLPAGRLFSLSAVDGVLGLLPSRDAAFAAKHGAQ